MREGRRPLWELLEEGHVLELSSGSGKHSLAAQLIVRAQRTGEMVAYIAEAGAPLFFAPDLVAMGIDLQALLWVRCSEDAPAGRKSAGAKLLRATEILLRSGAFGLLIVDLPALPRGELAWQARLLGLVRSHGSRLVFLTSSAASQPSLGSLVSLRVEPVLERVPASGAGSPLASRGSARLSARILKNKLGVRVDVSPDVRSEPPGAIPLDVP